MRDAIDELVARSRDCAELRAFHEYHRAHPEVLDFLVEEIRLRLESGFNAFSHRSLLEYARWKLEMRRGPSDTFKLNDHAGPFYARAIAILHPEFNGYAELRKAEADKILGTTIEPMLEKPEGCYARRLTWADGTGLEDGWRPMIPHTPAVVLNRRPDIHERED